MGAAGLPKPALGSTFGLIEAEEISGKSSAVPTGRHSPGVGTLTPCVSPQLPAGAGMGLLVLALASWLGLALASEGATNGSRLCREAPAWQINGSSPMAEVAGQVTVVALLKAS